MSNYLAQARNAIKDGIKRALKEKADELGILQEKMIPAFENSKELRILLWLSGCTVDDLLKPDMDGK